MTTLFKHKQALLQLLLVALVITLGVSYRSVPAMQVALMPELPIITHGARVMVISPHPDDETLGAGGLIHFAANNGAEVKVVFMTNGDGFRRGVVADTNKNPQELTPQCFRDYGAKRQLEAVAALRAYGLDADSATFLGFPDGGLSRLWWEYWSSQKAFVSRTTWVHSVPYADAYQPDAVYSGESLLQVILEVVSGFEPNVVILPHPHDNHADHWASYAFVAAALQLHHKQGGGEVQMYHYLIHRGSWQVIPTIYRKNPLALPRDVIRCEGTAWYRFSLSLQNLKAKDTAIRAHRSQYAVMGEFLKNFLRSNEMYGVLSGKQLPVTDGVLSMDEAWEEVPLVKDPRGDNGRNPISLAGDLRSLSMVLGSDGLYLRVETWAHITATPTIRVGLVAFSKEGEPHLVRCVFKLNPARGGAFTWEVNPFGDDSAPDLAIGSDFFTVRLPSELVPEGGLLMVGAESRVGSVVVDMIPWWKVLVK